MEQSESIKELVTALSKAQSEIGGAVKNSENPFFDSAYADLKSVWDACREPLGKNELSVIQTTQVNGSDVLLNTTIAHSSGQWVRGSYPLKPTKNDPQGMGSALSYARRYCLAAMVGIYQKDDDANLASKEEVKKPNNQDLTHFSTGKYKGKSFKEVYETDKTYHKFLERLNEPWADQRNYKEYVRLLEIPL